MRLIDADVLREKAQYSNRFESDEQIVFLDDIDTVPTVDAVPVVRCKDCIHYEMGVCLKIYDDGAANKDAWQERNPNDFCSYGERKERTSDD